jgi:hypothetical protein
MRLPVFKITKISHIYGKVTHPSRINMMKTETELVFNGFSDNQIIISLEIAQVRVSTFVKLITKDQKQRI